MYLLFDIGGTKTRVSVSTDLCSYVKPVKFDTPHMFQEGVQAIQEAARSLCGDAVLSAAAGGIRGPLKKDRTGIISEMILTDWVEKPLTEEIKTGLNVEHDVYLENDAAIVGLGEAHFGAGKGHDIVAYLTVSTGVGGVRIDHGAVDAATGNFEPGKSIIDIDNTVYPEINASSLEEFVSGSALEKRRGVKPYEISQDDPVWKELAHQLAVGIKNTIAYWSPDVIVLGGSMIIGDPRIFREDITAFTKKELDGLMPVPPILDAKLGDEGGLYGAMALLKQKEVENRA